MMKALIRLLLAISFAVAAVVVTLKFLSPPSLNGGTSLPSARVSSLPSSKDQVNQSLVKMPVVNPGSSEDLYNKAYQKLADLPLRFIHNAGQKDPAVKFYVKGDDQTLYFSSDGAVFNAVGEVGEQMVSSNVRLSFEGANPKPQLAGLGLMPGVVNYFLGNDPGNWHTSVDTYAGVSYGELFPGIKLVYRGAKGKLKSEFFVEPGGDPDDIQMVYSGIRNAFIREDSALVLQTYLGNLEEGKPLVYQEVDGAKRVIPARYILEEIATDIDGMRSYRVTFKIGEYDPNLPLLIDPILSFSSFVGGSQSDDGLDIAVDDNSNIYIAGYTCSTDFPTTTNAISRTLQSCADIFVTQILESSGVYTYGFSTYMGGSDDDQAHGIAVDSAGDVFIAGYTRSQFDFPIVNAPQPTAGNSLDGFAAKITNINGTASLAYSTYVGGSQNDAAYANALDNAGNHYITGETESSNYPTTANAIQPSYGGESINLGDIFMTKIISAGGVYTYGYSSYLGGNGGERGTGIAVGDDGDIYVTGYNYNGHYPEINNVFDQKGGGDAVVTKIDTSGTYTYEYSTYLGGDNTDWGFGIAVDDSSNAYVTGMTGGVGFPITNAVQTTFGGYSDIFVTKLESTGGKPEIGYSTYIGGGDTDLGLAIAVDGDGNAYVTGRTESSNYPTRSAFQPTYGGNEDAFITKIIYTSGVYTYAYSTFVGGWFNENEYDEQGGIAVDDSGSVYVVGVTASNDFPTTTNAIKSTGVESWNRDTFVLKIIGPGDLQISKYANPVGVLKPGDDLTYTLVYTNDSPVTISGVIITDIIPISMTNINFTSSGAMITATQDVTHAWQVDPIPPGAIGSITITGILDPSLNEEYILTNQAEIATKPEAYFGDDNPHNNNSQVQNPVVKLVEPIAGLSASNDGPTKLGDATKLNATTASGSEVTFNWNFGDGTNGSGAAVSHVYPHMGLFEAQVTASNPVNSLSEGTLVSIYEVFSLPPGSSTTTSDGLLRLISSPTCTGTFTITGRILTNPTFEFGDLLFGDVVFHLDAVDASGDPVTSFSSPMTLTVSYDESKLPPMLNEAELHVYRYDVGIADWVALPVINRDLITDKITVALDHFSEFILAAPRGVNNPVFIPLLVR